MRLQFIVCKVMQKEAYYCATRSKNIIDVVVMEQGLHEKPEKLRTELALVLERTKDSQGRPYDASILGYGLCSNGIVGLSAKIPLVIPRGHDCVTLLLGSKEKYQQYFDSHRGVYWFSPGWIETGAQPGKEHFERTLKQYIEKYGHDNAAFLMETHYNSLKQYNWAVYIDWGLPGSEEDKEFTRRCAEYLGWQYGEIKGGSKLMQKLVDGDWDEDKFLIVKPGQKIAEDLTASGLIKAE